MEQQEFAGRFDYVKCSISMEYDLAQEYANTWYDTFDPERGKDRAQRHANVQSVRRNRDGTFLYSFEAWGENAERIKQMPFEVWAPHLHRMDVRGNVEITPGGIDRLYSYLTKHKAGSKNVSLFSSRKRSKRAGRDTGGYGIAIGSHKSNLRTTFYVRGSERGAYEFQCMGSLLEGSVATASKLLSSPIIADDTRKWGAVAQQLWIRGMNDFESSSGLEEHELQTLLLSADAPAQPEGSNLAQLKSDVSKLTPTEARDLFTVLQLRLF